MKITFKKLGLALAVMALVGWVGAGCSKTDDAAKTAAPTKTDAPAAAPKADKTEKGE